MLLVTREKKLGFAYFLLDVRDYSNRMDIVGPAFSHLKAKFCKLSEAKLIEGVLVGSQIMKLPKDETFDAKLSECVFASWSYFKALVNVTESSFSAVTP